ncbi:MAG TPA: apolipoprotein N-acyltransferase [Verrucomicrobiae bacterium]|nr:apolipoprotein N-acyltransferase [Verrucomicrobiae bacterium]
MNVRRFVHCWLLPIATGVLLALALPPFNAGQLGWVGLVPLLFALENCSLGEAFRRGYIAGLVFFGLTVWWVIYTTEGGAPFGAALSGVVAMVAFLALYFGAAGAWISAVSRLIVKVGADSAGRNLLVAILSSAGWATLEWIRGKFLFGGFGWNGLGVTQHDAVPLIQFACFTGVYGVSALVCFFNFAFFQTMRRFMGNIGAEAPLRRLSWEFYVAMLLVCMAFIHGLHVIRAGREREPAKVLRLALIQADIPQTLKFEPEQKSMILQQYDSLTRTAMVLQPELIIWPETATPEPLRFDPDSFGLATNLAHDAHAYLLTGTIDATPFAAPSDAFNAAILLRPDGALGGVYHKIHLVPFGEYVPLRKLVPFMKRLTPIPDSFERGREFTVFEIGGTRFATVICFEDTVPAVYRGFVERGVDFMVNLTNDAWFKTSPAAEMHLANAVFRCPESQRPLVRCTNNGVTCIVDQFGFINPKTRLPSFTNGSLNCELLVPPPSAPTFYTRHGDAFVGVCGLMTGVALLAAWRMRTFRVQSRP